jgi:hypothetical protein
MKSKLLSIILLAFCLPTFAQFTTGTVTLTASPLMTVKIDTDATTTTLTLVGPSNTWLGIGFGATSMGNIDDYFIWSSAVNRDYSADTNDRYNTPMPDTTESWTIVSDVANTGVRTVVATRASTSSGDYTFVNSSTSIPIIYALSNSINLGRHNGTHSSKNLTRTALGVEDFSLNTAAIYPNPSNGNFKIEAKSILTKLNVYSQSGAFVKTIELDGNSNSEEVNLKDVASGVYLIELQSDSDKAWKKIIIQ